MRSYFFTGISVAIVVSFICALQWPLFYGLVIGLSAVLVVGIVDVQQTQHTIRRNFPFFGRARWLMEAIRPFVRQYFIESDVNGAPINRMFRSIVYQRAKGDLDSNPYGTKVDTYRSGYEWISHSIGALNIEDIEKHPRVLVGGSVCTQPYSASILNISAMSFGALSNNAILALNKGAKMGGFAHNTGEGSVSDYHLLHGGDLIWQIGTGYFGCRDRDGHFCPTRFAERAIQANVKMIEIKLSQGAKPGHGGILPAGKNTQEIARIRTVEPFTDVVSPSAHTAFSTPLELLHFVQKLRELSGGKPVGFKLCIGRQSEFVAICKAMIETGIRPDFITVDGGEGGTGAAPLEYSNSVGMPLREGIAFVADCLTGYGLRSEIRIIASGKIFTAFHLVRCLALGADMCNSARGMMLALGCVQSLVCNNNHCPTGIATQDPDLVKGLDVDNKASRVARFHAETVHAAVDITSSAGLYSPRDINRTHLFRRVDQCRIERFDKIFPYQTEGSFLEAPFPEQYHHYIVEASPEHFMPQRYVAH